MALTWGNDVPLERGSGTWGEGGTVAGDEFSELLGQLKERSGLSYGVLGKRLHMSASTLHRYVNGDAVPTDYAPVERFARVCKATPEELVELHRRWVLADARRGQKAEALPASVRCGLRLGRPLPEPAEEPARDGWAGGVRARRPGAFPEVERGVAAGRARWRGVGVPSSSPVPPWPPPSCRPRSW